MIKLKIEICNALERYKMNLLNCLYLFFPLCRKSGGRTDTAHSKGKLPVVYEKAKRLRLSDI